MAISTIGASALDSGVSQLGKNLIQNGSMTVNQRGTVSGPTNGYTLDRWHAQVAGAAVIDVSQDTSVVPSGFANSLKVDVTTADASLAASDRVHIRQPIEAQNLQHLLYGTANAKTLTATFRVRSPKAGTHCVALYQPDGSRSFVREYTIDSADTFETKTVTFPGDASGTINNDNGEGLQLIFPLAAGSDFHATADAWAAGFDFATSNQVNCVDNAANNFYITGVQLEVGIATDFEHEDIGTTLAKCLRYFWRYEPTNEISQNICVCFAQSVGTVTGVLRYPVIMRAAPSASTTAAATFEVLYNNGGSLAQSDCTGINVGQIRVDQATLFFGVSSDPFTIGEAAIGRRDSTDTTRIDLSAEL